MFVASSHGSSPVCMTLASFLSGINGLLSALLGVQHRVKAADRLLSGDVCIATEQCAVDPLVLRCALRQVGVWRSRPARRGASGDGADPSMPAVVQGSVRMHSRGGAYLYVLDWRGDKDQSYDSLW